MKILIVEDDPAIAGVVRSQVDAWGYEGAVVEDFQNVLEQFLQWKPQMVLLDISLPFYDGYYWCRKIREVSQVPVIFISSAADNMNVVMAVNMGADDFIAKPFDLQVLMAKIQAVMRRAYDFGNQIHWLEHKGAVLNTEDTSLHYRGERLELTKNDYRILQTLMENKGKVVSRDVLMTRLWETDSYIDENTLTVNVARLRRKLSSLGLSGFIQTKKGMGYIIE
ncbi:MAG: response regulator transcription factor [Lachnospiraceae bacterium]|nr:response regulator transcription factor [Lachnospiraceae bacterium]MCI9388645.1 response regulator transcription factor [Lachnospiraceae bacterium]MCI9471440.1 response regulator transcription factor [Lachnospiraceae bacterium]